MPKINFNTYHEPNFYDEMFDSNNEVRPQYSLFKERIEKLGLRKLKLLQHSTDRAQLSLGMTFNVYNDSKGLERILHLDIIPRIISAKDWDFIEKGLNSKNYCFEYVYSRFI